MAVNLGGVFVSMRARDAQFRRSMRRSAESVRAQQRALRSLRGTVYRTNRRFREFRRSVLSLRGAVGVVAGSSALGLLIKRQAEFGSSLIETSRQVNFSVESLQLLGRAFQGEGGNIESFNKGLRQFTRSVAEADRGVATYAHQFEAMGVTLRNEQGQLRDSEQILLDMANGLQGLGSQAEKTNAVMTLFGARNIAFQNILQNGRKALEDQLASFRRLGIVATDEAQRLKDLNQSFADLGNALQVASSRGVAVAAEEFRRFNETLIQIGPEAISAFIRTTTRLVENLHVLREIAVGTGLFFAVKWSAQIGRAVFAAKTFAAGLKAVGTVLTGLHPAGRILLGLGAAAGYFALRTREAVVEAGDLDKRFQENIDSARIATEKILAYNDAIQEQRLEIKKLTAELEKFRDTQLAVRQAGSAVLSSPLLSPSGEEARLKAIEQLQAKLRELEKDRDAAEQAVRSRVKAEADAIDAQAARIAAARERAQVTAPDFAGEVRVELDRENRLLQQKLDLLQVEGDARTRLQAQHQVENEFAERRIVLQRELNEARKRHSAATDKEQESAKTAVLIAEDRLAALTQARSQQDQLIEAQQKQLRFAEGISKFEAQRQQREANRTSILEAHLSHQGQLNDLLAETNRLEASAAALRARLSGQTPGKTDPAQGAVEGRAGELARELLAAQARGDAAAAEVFKASVAGLGDYRGALESLNQAREDHNDLQEKGLALTQAEALVQRNSLEGFQKQLNLEIQRLENASKLAKLEGVAKFDFQQQIKLGERRNALIAARNKANAEGNLAAQKALQAELEHLNKLYDQNSALNDVQKKRLAVLVAEADRLKKINAEAKLRLEFAKKTFNVLTTGIQNSITSGKKLNEVFKEMLATLIKVAFRILVLRQIESAFIGALRGGAAKSPTPAGAEIPPRFPGRAGGGPVSAGQLTLVGERGEELFRPTVPGNIIPNYKLRGALAGGGGPSFHFNFNIESTDGPGVEAALARRLPEMMQRAAEVAEKIIEVKANRKSPLRRKLRRR